MKPALRSTLFQFTRYGSVGLLTNGTVYLVFLAIVWAGLHPVLVSALCYCLAVTMSYALNRSWTFRSVETHRRDLPRFLLAYGIGLFFAMGCIAVCLIWVSPAIAQLITISLTAVVVYGALRVLRFGRERPSYAP
ncbi:MAG: GtrA family protein [Anderseniella sp.]|jgi:putative flippase GtrA|nr:GtrA family protein [Anderseniella sp.]